MIEVKSEFLDGATRYYAGEVVSEQNFSTEALAAYRRAGWLAGGVVDDGPNEAPTVRPADLKINIKA